MAHNCDPRHLAGLIEQEHTTEALSQVESGAIGGRPTVKSVTMFPENPHNESRFAQRVRDFEGTPEEMRADLTKNAASYEVAPEHITNAYAKNLIEKSPEVAHDWVMGDEAKGSAFKTTVAMELASHYEAKGDYTTASNIIRHISEEGSRHGQAIQAFARWNRTTRAGAIREMDGIIRKANEGLGGEKPAKDLIRKTGEVIDAVEGKGGVRDDVVPDIADEFGKRKVGKKTFNDFLKEKGVDFKELVKQHYFEVNSDLKALEAAFIKNLDLTQPQAIKLVSEFKGLLDAKVDAARKTKLDQLLKVIPQKERQTFIEKLTELSNAGGLTHDAYREAIGKKFGVSVLTEAKAKEVLGAVSELQNLHLQDWYIEGQGKVNELKAQLETVDPAKALDTASFERLSKEQMILTNKLEVMEHELAERLKDEKAVKVGLLNKKMGALIPKDMWSKLSTFQTLAMLTSPKTGERNIIGNETLGALNNTLVIPTASVIDRGLSLITGKRAVVMPQLKEYAKGRVEGFKKGVRDVHMGIDTTELGAHKYTLHGEGSFKHPILVAMQKMVGYILGPSDRSTFEGTYKESVANQMKAQGLKEPTPEILKVASLEAAYSTLRDETLASKFFEEIRKNFNLVSPETVIKARKGQSLSEIKASNQFGLGNQVAKFARTSGNLLTKSLVDYSPLGFVKGLSTAVTDGILRKPFNQREFAHTMARAFHGTATIGGAGWVLGSMGLAVGSDPVDRDVAALKRDKLHIPPNSVNMTGLTRVMASLFQDKTANEPREGDIWLQLGWAPPIATTFFGAVNLQKTTATSGEGASFESSALDALSGATELAIDQSIFQGVRDITNTRDSSGNPTPVKGVANVLANSAASFIPQPINHANQLLDNSIRETYDPDLSKQALNKVIAKIPLLSRVLPQKRDAFGELKERYQNGSNNLLNVTANPAIVGKMTESPEVREIMRLYSSTGETSQTPRVVSKAVQVTIGGQPKKIKLTGQQVSEYQQYAGGKTKVIFNQLIGSKMYDRLSDEAKVQVLSTVLSDVNTAAKVKLFNHELSSKPNILTLGIMRDNPQLINLGLVQLMANKVVSEKKPKLNYSILGR